MSELLRKHKEESVTLLKRELNDDLSISSIIEYLKEKSSMSLNGRAGTHTTINKEALRLAAVYLEDCMLMLGE